MKKFSLTRILALLFAVAMLLSIVACTKDPDKEKESETPAVTDPQTPQESQSQVESETEPTWETQNFYNGETFTVLAYDAAGKHTWSTVPEDVFVETNDGDILSNAVYQRGLILKDKLGVQLEVVRWHDGFGNELTRDISDGEYRYQLVIPQTLAIAVLLNNTSITSVNKTGIDFTYPWYDKQTADCLTIKGKTVAVASDMTFIDKLCAIAVFYNKQLASDNDLGDLYSMVNNKEWNFTKMLEMCETVIPVVDEDGAYTVDDTYGISCQNDGAYYFYHASGLTSVSRKSNGGLSLTFNSEESVDVLEDVLSLTSDKRVYLNAQASATKFATVAEIATHFASGKALFLVRPLQSLFDLSQATDNYGIIPMPMMTEGQEEYFTPVNPHASSQLCFPSKITDPSMTEDVIQWLGSYSRKNINNIFYEVVLGSRMTQDKDSPKMLDIIFESRIYDIGYVWDVTNVRSLLTSTIGPAKIQPGSVKTTIDRYITPMNLMIGKLETSIGNVE